MRPPSVSFLHSTLVVLLAAGCAASADPWILADGRSAREILPLGAPAMLVLIDPSDCSQCNPQIPLWIEAQRSQPQSIHFVFIRQPTQVDLRQAALLHLKAGGILRRVPAAWEKNGRRPLGVFWTQDKLYAPMPMRAAASIWKTSILAKTSPAQAHDPHLP